MKRYLKNNKECIFCNSRRKLIQVTPEEIVRQEFVSKLINEYHVPQELISVEVPLSYYKKGKPGRADIIVLGLDQDSRELIPLIVIECKAPNIHLTDKVFQQVMGYDEFLGPEIMVMTNGIETISYSWNNEKDDYCKIEFIPSYADIIAGIDLKFQEDFNEPWIRPDHKDPLDINYQILLNDAIIGEDSNKMWIPLITNLAGLIYDESQIAKNIQINDKTKVIDGGLRYTTFGNAGGGSFTGMYRYFMLENLNNETEIISISIMGKLSSKNHPKWGNSKGNTIFNIAIDDFENSHLSLEYALDRFVTKENCKYSFWHDGTLTVGKLGRVKNIEVINYIKENSPSLIKDDRIYLGTVDNTIEFKWEDIQVASLISNFIKYGIIRDQFRRAYKQASI
ncbi:type I restriction enzyme HsdR N-terminal domain-containing protein [Gillisia limnaea]|uniref:Type I restriction enzyme R protein N-terminal domain-containing protein n=1 Tax=Gillisia limnaea (strain DSM 15749 / LMG 21470 / R-8282) TaxID=865937 RepID=H2BTH3_GILLR|nr:type I restriction enzyme HsdR N-terminal domain-containing protein [Gillisia limnaea]EHQ01559.1 hypothetical protein Gilli_0869 [Gillisia limnaea DSM 15749]